MINQPDPVSAAVQPRAMVFVNGELIQFVSAAVDNNSFFQADTFRVVLALSSQPEGRGFNFWGSLEKAEIEIFFGFPVDPVAFSKADLVSFLYGYVDDIEIDPIADQITLAGRDLTSLLIDARQTLASVSYAQKASDIVAQIAKNVGLKPVVTATSIPVGKYQQIVHALLEQKATYWDLVTKLAQIEGFQAYVTGHELHFQPFTAPSAEPYVIRYTTQNSGGAFALNATRLIFTRNLSVAKDLKVDILSFNSKTGKVTKGHAERPRNYNKITRGVAKLDGTPQAYFYAIPNLDGTAADAMAAKILKYLSSHEMNLSGDLPGDALLTPQSLIQVEGTGTPFDQTYYASSIQRTFSFEDGFRMSVTGKNQSPNNPPKV
jgi:phage protein D